MTATTPPASGTATRPGGRSAKVRAAVHRAVQVVVAEDSLDVLTIPVIAARAGVHATTVYRRWGTVGDLLADVANSRFTGDLVVPDTGSLRGDLERYAFDLAKDLGDPDTLALVRATIGKGGEQGAAACRGEREQGLAAILERERARGGQPPALEHTTDGVLAPLYYRAVFTDLPLTAEWARGLITRLLSEPDA